MNLHQEVREKLPNTHLIGAVQLKSKRTIKHVTQLTKSYDSILVDSYVKGKKGGTGKTHNWNLTFSIREQIFPKPLILAGGLNTQNVRKAISTVKPYGVDVSSGVEGRLGKKNAEKIQDFIKTVKKVDL
jgi:phosphoribosylanthranilate isomerase